MVTTVTIRPRKWGLRLLAAICALVTVLDTSPIASPLSTFTPPRHFYLALGDSFTYGFQFSKAGMPAAAFNTGYVDVFGAQLRDIQPGLTIVNYGCPGESTASFIAGPCPTQSLVELHDFFTGSQLDAAVDFLRAHPGEVSPITVTLWGNDVREFVGGCGDQACVAAGAGRMIQEVTKNLRIILGRLRGAAPDAEIIVTGAWDPFIDALPFADPLFQQLNTQLSAATIAARARFADPFPIFNPPGDLQHEIQTICTLTLSCTQNDSHPSDAGYRVLGELVFEVSGYEALLQ
jgi:lysophospholipase L1-like esterase